MKISLSFSLMLLCFVHSVLSEESGEIENSNHTLTDVCPLDSVLSIIGLDTSDIGYKPVHYWMSYPHPDQILYTLPVFSDLYAQPVYIYSYIRQAAREFQVNSEISNEEGDYELLYLLSFRLGINRIYTGFRPYGSNPELFESDSINELNPDSILFFALDHSLDIAQKWEHLKGPREELRSWKNNNLSIWKKITETSSPEQKMFYAILIYNISEAYNYAGTAFRKTDSDELYKFIAGCDSEDSDFLRFREDLVEKIDFASLWYSSLKTAELAGLLIFEKPDSVRPPDTSISLPTPLGPIIIGDTTGTRRNFKDVEFPAIFDWGGADTYDFSFPECKWNGVFLLIDLAGDDVYWSDSSFFLASGVLGVSVLIDVDGNDLYESDKNSLGWGNLGFGALFDLKGDDIYTCKQRGLGASYTGVGLLSDFQGFDSYSVHQEGIGYGAFGGIGVCADREGDDMYYAEAIAENTGLEGDYHSGEKILGNMAMGAGWGLRADMDDGHNYGGGIGMLIDLEGNDEYSAGNWAQGVGYWLGMGFLYDRTGNDYYRSCYFSTASGAHYAIGALIDEGGDDIFEMWGDSTEVPEWGWAGAGLAFGWDYVIALLVNIGGDDLYRAKKISLGCSQIRSNAFFIDVGGNDTYQFPEHDLGMGASDVQDNYDKPFYCFSKSIGIFIDQDGDDKYYDYNFTADSFNESKTWRNRSIWYDPESIIFDCHGIGMDF